MRNSTRCVTVAAFVLCIAGVTRHTEQRVEGSEASALACEPLSTMRLTSARVTFAGVVDAGAFAPPGSNTPTNTAYAKLPAFCRVAATLTPTSDSDIKIEVWMPMSNWNQKLQSVGNGGWAGTISYGSMAAALARGTPRRAPTRVTPRRRLFAMNHPEKLIDYAHRAVHEMTVQAKAIVQAFYGGGPKLSLWNGCSTGGRQGVIEASSYPADYDGIIAGATPVTTPKLTASGCNSIAWCIGPPTVAFRPRSTLRFIRRRSTRAMPPTVSRTASSINPIAAPSTLRCSVASETMRPHA